MKDASRSDATLTLASRYLHVRLSGRGAQPQRSVPMRHVAARSTRPPHATASPHASSPVHTPTTCLCSAAWKQAWPSRTRPRRPRNNAFRWSESVYSCAPPTAKHVGHARRSHTGTNEQGFSFRDAESAPLCVCVCTCVCRSRHRCSGHHNGRSKVHVRVQSCSAFDRPRPKFYFVRSDARE